jgi:hypothetical protein
MNIPMNPTFLINQLSQQAMINQLSRLAMTNQGTTNQMGTQNQFPPVPVSPFLNPYLYGNYGGYGGNGGTYNNNNPSYGSEPSYSKAPANKRPSVPDLPWPSPEIRNRRAEQVSLERALTDAPMNEVTSGVASNAIVGELQRTGMDRGWKELPGKGLDMPADMLSHINVTRNGTANGGILKQWDQVNWPAALSGPEFKLQRNQVNDLVNTAMAQAKTGGRVTPAVIQKLNDNVSSLQQQLRDNALNLSFDTHAEAKTFLNNLQAGITALQRSDAAFFVNGKFQVTAKTIPELVQWMTDYGLKFAPALPGDEAAYMTLRDRLAAYDLNLRASAAAESAKPVEGKVEP